MSETIVIDPLVTSWFETVQALKTVEEREELSHFIRHDLRLGVGAGILRGLFLLLKANRLYLEQLPGKYNQELVQPMRDLLLRLEKSLAGQMEAQKQIATQNERTAQTSFRVMERMESIVPKVETVVQEAFDSIDTKALTQKITDTVVKSTVEPVAKTNKELQETAKLLAGLIEKAKEVLGMLRKISWTEMFLASLGITFSVWALIFFFAYQSIQHSFDDSLSLQNQKLHDLAASIEKVQSTSIGNQQASDQLSRLQVTIEVKQLSDGSGRYALTLPGADAAQVMPDGTGMIAFQGNDLNSLLERQMEDNRKLLGH
jgi:hypothetical protein